MSRFTKTVVLCFSISMCHIIGTVVATIDLTLPELEYLANHLTEEECHKVAAALHFDSYKLNQLVENAENAVPEGVSCLKLLLHWNSSPGEGLGETHERLSLRLRQIGRRDLATWLDSAVLDELEAEMNGIMQQFQETTTSGDEQQSSGSQDNWFDDNSIGDEFWWDVLMGIAPVTFIVLVALVLFLVMRAFVQQCKVYKNTSKNQTEVKSKGSRVYERL